MNDPAQPTPQTQIVDAPSAGSRLDAFLAQAAALPSAAMARRLIENGRVWVNGRHTKKGERVEVGQTVAWQMEAEQPAVVPAPDLDVAVLFADEDLVAINKPSGVPSHPLRPGEGGTAAGAIIARFPTCAHASVDPREGGLVHRLDVETSGVLIAACSPQMWAALREVMKAPGCEKTYLAEVAGVPPLATIVTASIGRSGRHSGRVQVGAGRGLLPARTEVQVIGRKGPSSLVEARLGAGRPHQVRAHLAHLGHPVLGDALYSDRESQRIALAVGASTLRLHAVRVTLPHPRTGVMLTIEAPRPAWAADPGFTPPTV